MGKGTRIGPLPSLDCRCLDCMSKMVVKIVKHSSILKVSPIIFIELFDCLLRPKLHPSWKISSLRFTSLKVLLEDELPMGDRPTFRLASQTNFCGRYEGHTVAVEDQL